MKVAVESRLKGAALLAASGVSLADAQWLFAAQRAGGPQVDPVRLAGIHRKVTAYLEAQSTPARVHRYA